MTMDPLPDRRERAGKCPRHGDYVSRLLTPNTKLTAWSQCPACVAEQRLADEVAARREVRESADRRHAAMLEGARIPAKFVGKGFDDFVATTPEQVRALNIARQFAADWPANRRLGRGLIFSGNIGTGKTHLAAAIMQDRIGPFVRFISCGDLIRAVRDTWRKESPKSETQILAYFEQLDLLVIDEIGVQYGTAGEQTVLFEVLDRRYRECKPTILLTNANLSEFRSLVGERVFDRLGETCAMVLFDWPTYRPTARKLAA